MSSTSLVARSCCSVVTPGTPDRSTGWVGSHGRGHARATGSAAGAAAGSMMWTWPSSAADSVGGVGVPICRCRRLPRRRCPCRRSPCSGGGAVGGSFLGAVRVPVGRRPPRCRGCARRPPRPLGVDVRAGGEHRPHGEHAEDDGGDDQAALLAAFGREDRSRVGGEDGDGGEQRRRRCRRTAAPRVPRGPRSTRGRRDACRAIRRSRRR